MCGLCGILGDGSHWADGVAGPGETAASAVPWLRRQARRQRVSLGNQVLRHRGLSIADWQGASYLLRGRTGATAIVTGLGDLWPAVDRLSGAPLDPLDPALLEAIERRAG